MSYSYTTQEQVRDAFFADFGYRRKLVKVGDGYYRKASHNEYSATVRTAFSFFIDGLEKSGKISEALADRVTLG